MNNGHDSLSDDEKVQAQLLDSPQQRVATAKRVVKAFRAQALAQPDKLHFKRLVPEVKNTGKYAILAMLDCFERVLNGEQPGESNTVPPEGTGKTGS